MVTTLIFITALLYISAVTVALYKIQQRKTRINNILIKITKPRLIN